MTSDITPRMLYLRQIIRKRFTRGADWVLVLARAAVADGCDIEEMIESAKVERSWRAFSHKWLSRCREK